MALTFKKHQFANGLRLIVHENNNTPMATFHVTYNVGARCENPERTGLAHLLEHYMTSPYKKLVPLTMLTPHQTLLATILISLPII